MRKKSVPFDLPIVNRYVEPTAPLNPLPGRLKEHEVKPCITRESVCSLETLTILHSSTRATEWFKRLVSYAKCNRDSSKTIQDEARGLMLGLHLATSKHFNSGLVESTMIMMVEKLVIMDVS
uniref:Uncharacterized protein n=1 Tax=Tanacetum cinerariifolium TaxID=118510 RepID=A0A6L2NMF8_TANCI|nr:hypothetical protein [Tanacetum cinerariifolium]